MNFPDYYDILGLPRFYPTQEEIRDAFLNKVVELNASGGINSEARRTLDFAYMTLSDAKRKREYDEVLDRYVQFREPVAFQKTPKRINSKIVVVSLALLLCVLGLFWQTQQSKGTVVSAVSNSALPSNAPTSAPPADTANSKDSAVPNSKLVFTDEPLPRPQNEHIFSQTGTHNSSELQIVTSGTRDYFIKLEDVDNQNRRVWFYVRGGSTANINVTPGTYTLKYACGEGDSWYGLLQYFGKSTSYVKTDDLFVFTDDKGWTVELFPHFDGNLAISYIDAEEF